MKIEFLAGLLAAAVSGSAMAADLPAGPPGAPAPVYYPTAPAVIGYNWSGLYLGINGGGAWGRSRFDYPLTATTTGNFNTSGGVFGVTAGANWQISFVVFGFEGDVDWADIKGSATCPAPVLGATCQSSDSWLATASGRLGFAINEWLIYGTAGVALGDVRTSVTGVGSQFADLNGWTAGGGIEHGFSQSWSVKAEYLHVDLGTAHCAPGNCAAGAVAVANVPYTANIFRAGVNYRFGWGGPLVARY